MEQKRTLWIIAAVGVFLLVVLGAALILYSPNSSSGRIASVREPAKNGDSGWISLAPTQSRDERRDNRYAENRMGENRIGENRDYPYERVSQDFGTEDRSSISSNIEKSPVEANTVTRVGELTVYADKATIISSPASSESNQAPQTVINNTTTIDLTGAQHPVVLPPSRGEVKNQAPAVAVKPATKPASSSSNASSGKSEVAKTQQKPASKPAAQTAAPKTPEKIQYWVQVTSLESRKRADIAREVLGENKIPADVFTYVDSKNRTFYRVRVGPYTTKTEAEYWKTRVSEINEFKKTESFVASTRS